MKINQKKLREMIKGYIKESLMNKNKLTESKRKIKKVNLKDLISEEIMDWQGRKNEDFKFKVGMIVRDINPDCPHHGSEGTITEITGKSIKYEVRNIGRVSNGSGDVKYEPGDILTKTKDQLYPLSLDSVNKDFKKINLKKKQ